MAEYIDLALTSDATALSDEAKAYMADQIPGWVARAGNVESVLLEGNAQIAAEVVDQASEVPPVIFAYYGQWLLGIPLREAVPATSLATFTFSAPATVPAGSLFTVPNPDGNSYVFQTDEDVRSDVSPFTTTTTALEAGAAANGSTGVGEMLDVIDGVETVSMASASGGSDEEDADSYLNRLTDALTILAPRPILPGDFATLARQVPGVGRTLAINLYQPSTAEGGVGEPRDAQSHTNVARCVTVAITDAEGNAPSPQLMQQVYTVLDEAREVNFQVYVIPPTYTTINVQAQVTPYPGYLADEVAAAAEGMLRTWLDPLTWGSQTVGEVQTWVRDLKVRLYEAVDWLNRADGVFYVDQVMLAKDGEAFAAADISLAGAAPLPRFGTADITVNAPPS
jgi:uncharacterized phage protein gp47/JayE